MLDRLERRFGRYALPHLVPLLVFGQLLVYLFMLTGRFPVTDLMLSDASAASGRFWQFFTFLFVPMDSSPLWLLIGLYVTWLIGSSLEKQWGEFRFNLYLWTSWGLTVLLALLPFHVAPEGYTNMYILTSLTLAFARLFPEVTFLIFFVVPVQVKWIGRLLWAMLALQILAGASPWIILAGVSNYFLFFGKDHVDEWRNRSRRSRFQREAEQRAEAAFHTCSVCGKSDKTHPKTEFRYRNGVCYCQSYLSKGTCDDA